MRELTGVAYHQAVGKDSPDAHLRFRNYQCGWCHAVVDGRVVADWPQTGGTVAMLCACSCGGPSALVAIGEMITSQAPAPLTFKPNLKWPPDLAKLYVEASSAYSAGATTACAMVCRKILMACACDQGDKDGESFVHYVDYITNTVLAYPKAKAAINQIRTIGNDANHVVTFVTEPEAETAMKIITYMLDTLYAFPEAHTVPPGTSP